MFSGLVTLEGNHKPPPTVPKFVIKIPIFIHSDKFNYDITDETYEICWGKYHHVPELHKTIFCRLGAKINGSLILIWINHVMLLCNNLVPVQSLFRFIIRFHGCVNLYLVETQLFQRPSFQGLSLFFTTNAKPKSTVQFLHSRFWFWRLRIAINWNERCPQTVPGLALISAQGNLKMFLTHRKASHQEQDCFKETKAT